jgi:Fe-S-cluster containining protein
MSLQSLQSRDAQLVQITDAAFADAARRSGPHLACRPGCTQCCHGAFAIHTLDAWRLRRGMQELVAHDPERAKMVRHRADEYVRNYAPSFPGDVVRGILDTSEEAKAAFEEFANEAACPALDPASGLCDLYAARPMTCRVFGPPVSSTAEDEEGLAVCELCFTEATEEETIAAEMHPPHTEEQALLEMLQTAVALPRGETIVAWCLIDSPIDTAE